MRARWVLLLVVGSFFAWAGPKAPGKKKKPAPAPVAAEAELKKSLDATQAAVGGCVVKGAEGGPKTWTQVVKLKVVVNGVGQVMTLDAKLEPENANAEQTKACVVKALQAATFPATHAPMVTVEREWTFAMQ